MKEPDGKFEEEIRRALCAAGDLVVPAGDGLTKIRERAARRPHALGWLFAYATHLPGQLVRWLRVAASEVAATARGHSSLAPGLQSAKRWPRHARHALRSPSVWLRPVLTAAAALLIVLAVTLAVPRLRATVVGATLGGFTSPSGQNAGGPGGAGAGPGGADSTGAGRLGAGFVKATPGQPVDATMPPTSSSRCRAQSGSGASHHSGGTYIPPSPAPGPGQTVGAGTDAYLQPGTEQLGPVGPVPVSSQTWCSRATSSAAGPPTTIPTTPLPPTTPPPTTPPPTSPPPTSPPPTTTPPPTTSPPPTTTPPTTSPPTTTNSPDGSSSPSGSAAPG